MNHLQEEPPRPPCFILPGAPHTDHAAGSATSGTGIEPSHGAQQGREKQGTGGLFTILRERMGKKGLCAGTALEIRLRGSKNVRNTCAYKPT